MRALKIRDILLILLLLILLLKTLRMLLTGKGYLLVTFLYAICNAGKIIFDCTHYLDFIPLTAYHNPQSVANVLAAHKIDKIPCAHIFHDGSKDPHYYVIFKEGRVMKFIRCNEGLYYYDVT